MQYEIAVLGNDEAAFEMLALAARSNRRTVGILSVARHSEWLVGHALRRLVSTLLIDRSVRRQSFFRHAGSPRLLQSLVSRAIAEELTRRVTMLENIGVDVLTGETQFIDRTHLLVNHSAGKRLRVEARHVVIGTGVRRRAMHRPMGTVPFHQPESLLKGCELPKSVTVLGGQSFGAGLAALVSLFGVNTGLVAREEESAVMIGLARAAGVNVGPCPADIGLPDLESDAIHEFGRIVDCRRGVGFSDHLGLEMIDVEADENGQLWCGSNFETWCSGVFGIGEIVGFSPESLLHPSTQVERVMNRIIHADHKPHLRTEFVRSLTTKV